MREKVLVVTQPNYLPWIGYFDLIAQADDWVCYDDVQYTRRDWRNRNRVAGSAASEWLTVPVKNRGRYMQRIDEVEIDYEQPWTRRHLRTLTRCYARAPFAAEVLPWVEEILERRLPLLVELDLALVERACVCLGITARTHRSSRLGLEGDRVERLADACRRFGAAIYLSGPSAGAYLAGHEARFAESGARVSYIAYEYPPYERGGSPADARLSIVDTLAWLGAEGAAEYLRRHGGRRSP